MFTKKTTLLKLALGLFTTLSLYAVESKAICYPQPMPGHNYFPIAVVDTYNGVGHEIYFRVIPNYSGGYISVYHEIPGTTIVEYFGDYGITEINGTDDSCNPFPAVWFKVRVLGDNDDTWLSMKRFNDDVNFVNTLKWQGQFWGRSVFDFYYFGAGSL